MPRIESIHNFFNVTSHFIREVSSSNFSALQIKANGHSNESSPLIPVSYLHELFSMWRDSRGASPFYKMSRTTFAAVISRFDPNHCGIPPLHIICKTKKAVRCVYFEFADPIKCITPELPIASASGIPLTDASGPFQIPPLSTFSPSTRDEVSTLNKLMEREARLKAQRAEWYGNA